MSILSRLADKLVDLIIGKEFSMCNGNCTCGRDNQKPEID